MIHTLSAPFPNHQFDFGDLVFVLPLQQNGTVAGILHHQESWLYRVNGLQMGDDWWQEGQLTFADLEGGICESIPCQSEAERRPEN